MPLRLKSRWVPSPSAAPGASPIFLPQSTALVDQRGFVTRAWWPWFQQIVDAIVDLMQNGGGGGDVTGPATAEADALAVFNGTTGKVIKDSGTTLTELKAEIRTDILPADLATETVGTLPDARLTANVLKHTGGYPGGTTTYLRADGSFAPVTGGGTGDVTGPAAATDSHVTLFNGATGKVIKDSGVAMANIAIRNQSNTFTTVTATSNVDAALWMQTPQVVMIDNSQPANARRFDLRLSTQFFVVQVSADGGGALFNALGTDRNGDLYAYRNIYEKARSVPMGHWVDEPFNAANFSCASGTISGISTSRNKYCRIGNTMIWQQYGTATFSGTSGVLCRIPTVLSSYNMTTDGGAFISTGGGQIVGGRCGTWDSLWIVVMPFGVSLSGASNWSFSIVLETF